MRNVLAAATGAAVALALWLILLPWDLSEVDVHGLPREGGDAHATEIAAVAVAVTAGALVLVLFRASRWAAVLFAAGALGAWGALFAWRAGTAETTGANLFMVPLLFVVIPVAVLVPLVFRRVSAHLAA